MELADEQIGIREEYYGSYDRLIGDERTRRTFRGVLEGITGGESVCAASIARFSPRNGEYQVC